MKNLKPSWAVIMGLVFYVSISFLVQSCATQGFKTNAYKTLAAGAAIYESGYPAFLELHQHGLVSDAQKAFGKDLAVKYWAAYHAAVDALIAYDAMNSAENQARVKTALDEAIRCLSNLSAYIQPFLSKGR